VLLLHHVVIGTLAERVWTEIVPFHLLIPLDLNIGRNILEHDPLRFTMMPSNRPSTSPSVFPSIVPSHEPSIKPSVSPSFSAKPTETHPSISPSGRPIAVPSRDPTLPPSTSPTPDQYPESDLPGTIPTSYFNYDTLSSYGPGYPARVRHNATMTKIIYQNNGWQNAMNRKGKDFYWDEFDTPGSGAWAGVLGNKQLGLNQCEKVGKQSPIDVRDSGAECIEHHQIRTRNGNMVLGRDMIEPRIESNKLRLYFKRRACANLTALECAETNPPHADFPNNWGGYADLMNVDFKIPSEHTIYGERFDAEMQIFHLHPSRRRTPTVAVVIRASRSGYNPIFQDILDQFQYAFNDHGAQCLTRLQRQRRQTKMVHVPTEHEDRIANAIPGRRKLQSTFNPHHELLVPSLHFFGYEGSITEPPCSEFVSWFVSDTPMQVGFSQLEQMKIILFQHVSPTCEKTSVHSNRSVARPIQDSFGRPVWRCTDKNFLGDDVRFRNDDVIV